jgi:hypothetical protein
VSILAGRRDGDGFQKESCGAYVRDPLVHGMRIRELGRRSFLAGSRPYASTRAQAEIDLALDQSQHAVELGCDELHALLEARTACVSRVRRVRLRASGRRWSPWTLPERADLFGVRLSTKWWRRMLRSRTASRASFLEGSP